MTLIATVKSAQEDIKWFVADQSAASESQIKFAIENKYDDTGPGAKEPQYAYSTYKTLEDALVAYLDDPDTQLPEYERSIAMQKFLKSQPTRYQTQEFQGFYPKSVEEHISYQKTETPFIGNKYSFSENKVPLYYQQRTELSGYHGKGKPTETFALHQVKPVKGNPLSLAHYTRDHIPEGQRTSRPQYTFSYGVHVSNL